MTIALQQKSLINENFYQFINQQVLPLTSLNPSVFWAGLHNLVEELAPQNRALLHRRDQLQQQIDDWHQSHRDNKWNAEAYKAFLQQIGYLVEQGEDFQIETTNVDDEIARLSGPQLVVPLKNARFTLNAANARWGSLYDALYASDVIPHQDGLKPGRQHNPARARHVIAYAKTFLDSHFALEHGSHQDVVSYVVYFQHLMAFFADGSHSGLKSPQQFVAYQGAKAQPETLLLKHHGLHVELQINPQGDIGKTDLAGIDDIQLEAALTTIADGEDSVAAIDAEDKIEVYQNWLGLMQGTLSCELDKNGKTQWRKLNADRCYTAQDGSDYRLSGRALLLVRNVGHLMDCDLMQDQAGNFVPEGIMDAVVTALIGSLDINTPSDKANSRSGSIYIVKPKMHGPEEVAFTDLLFSRTEDLLELPRNTLKLGIMDEERRTSLNLKACIREAKQRVVFINTGFLDRTGDEIHTSMQAGAFLPKALIKQQPWFAAYENNNVDVALACGFAGKAQIGKGMWAMPDEMARMLDEKIGHPQAGASTAWVPSPSAATLHAMHYHQIDVQAVQQQLASRGEGDGAKNQQALLTIPLLPADAELSPSEIESELENNIQGILGYVVRWIELGIGCSKVPDIQQTQLMEDRATLRISSQHIANWLEHQICTPLQVELILQRMAQVVDEQNRHTAGYQPMSTNLEQSQAYQAAKALIFAGAAQPSGYTEPLLHHYRHLAKQADPIF
ncbi:malate synthase G [Neptunicella marina]|uniref:Malate synthase G n=1 Tax=Neptunicella marina TaxID=2125989 RepID=A0A8J6IQJ0_9ALTE|nr:malate synthase G [Neptunicella marina]MBC3764704.1 malate synthase G [Neptunicella marina]